LKFWDEWKGTIETAAIVFIGQSVLGLQPVVVRGLIGLYLARRATSVLRHYPEVRDGNWIDESCEAGWYVGKQFLGYVSMDTIYLLRKHKIEWDMVAHHMLFITFQFYIIIRQKSLGSLLRTLQTEFMPFLTMCIHLLQIRDREKLPASSAWRKRILFIALLRILGFGVWRISLWCRIAKKHYDLWSSKDENRYWIDRIHGLLFCLGGIAICVLDGHWTYKMSAQLWRWVQKRIANQ